jgi:predicted phosphodiesterase
MKIAVASDLHLEFGDLEFDNADGAEVLILSGDICVANDLVQPDPHGIMGEHYRSNRYQNFFERCCERFSHVIYVLGNHEHYHGDYAKTLDHMRSCLGRLKNLHIMEKETLTIGATTFVAGTLWTDMNREDPQTLGHMKSYMNDFRIIDDSRTPVNFKTWIDKDKPVGMTDEEWLALPYEDRVQAKFKTRPGKWSPQASVVEHRAMMEHVRQTVEADPTARYVVVGHHAPSKMSTKPKYQKDVLVNGAYSSSLDEFILDHPQIKMWTHGHTHDMFDYMIGSCRIVCNPRGYHGHEEQANLWQLITVDV